MNKCNKSGHKKLKTVCEDCDAVVNRMEFPKKSSEKMYSLEHLERRFADDAIRAEENNKKLIKQYQESNPGKPLPDHFKEEFNIIRTFKSIVSEILKLKRIN